MMNDAQLLQLTKDLIAADTTNPPGGQTEVIDILGRIFSENDISWWVETVDGQSSIFAELWLSGEGASVCWMGHWDVVPAGSLQHWTECAPFDPVVKNGCLYGRGACDMKSGVAAGVAAVLDLRQERGLSGTVIIAVLADEENGGIKGAEPLIGPLHEKYRFSHGIVGEPTGFAIKVARRGVCWGQLTLTGRQAHAARPAEGINPIYKLGRAISALETLTLTSPHAAGLFSSPTLAVTTVKSGDKDNVIPMTATAGFDIRTVPGQTVDTLATDIHSGLNAVDLRCPLDYDLQLNWLANPYLTEDQSFIDLCRNAIHRERGSIPESSYSGGTSDGRFLAELGVPVLEIGLEDTSLHQVNEFCRVDSLFILRNIYRDIFRSLLTTGPRA